MLFSFNTLKKLANLKPETSVEDVVKAINSIGFEVEEYNKFVDVEGIKFAKILEVYKNPNAEKLNVCRLQFDDQERIIQTNASNVQAGQTIIAFIPGSKINGITFGAKELKGIVSEGMLSAISEFGVNKDLLRVENYEGITKYDVEDLSLDPIDYLELNDYIIDVSILSNRSDANSYYVMARELAAYFHTNFQWPQAKESTFKSDLKVKEDNSKSLILFEAKNDFNLSIQDQIFLAKNKVKSINDIVDLTNLSLLMTGQPTHAYDKNKVGQDFSVNYTSETLEIFGNKEVKFDHDIAIFSNSNPVSIAGVIGLENTKVDNQTQDFIVELGRFNIKEVRKAVKSVKLNTNASNQSSKEIALGTSLLALNYLSNKLNSFSQNCPLIEVKDKVINFDENELFRVAGKNIKNDPKYTFALKSLEILGFIFKDNQVVVPNYRHDVNSQQDMNEEVFRFYGYDNFDIQPPQMSLNAKVLNVTHINNIVAHKGYQEVVTYSLISKERNNINPFEFKENINLETFISTEREVIRNSQAISLLEVIEYNQKRKINDISIFDIGMINNGVKTLALASTTKDFQTIKQDIMTLLPTEATFKRIKNTVLHPGVSAGIYLNNKMIGWIGKVHPSISNIDAFVAEVILPLNQKDIKFASYDNSPLKTRDITFDLKVKEEITNYINQLEKDFTIFSIKVIDKFLKDDLNKVTLRITADENTIDLIDQKYNK